MERTTALGKSVVLVAASLILAACAIGQYNPDPALATGVVKNLAIANPVVVVNNQTSIEPINLPRKKIVVDRKSFTESLVNALKLELIRNKVSVADSAEKKLLVSVTEIKMFPDGLTMRAQIDAEVTMGNGKVEKFTTTRASYGSDFNRDLFPTKPIDSAFKDMVQNILENANILRYLAN